MKNPIAFLLLFVCALVQAQVPYSFTSSWSFNSSSRTGAATVSTATPANAIFGTGVTDFAFVSDDQAGTAYEARTNWTTAASRDSADYISVCLNANTNTYYVSGATVTLNFQAKKNNQGPQDLEVLVSTDNFLNDYPHIVPQLHNHLKINNL